MTTNSQENKLIDKFGRRVDYVRLSVTDRCDFRCVYCMTEGMTFLPRDQVLSLEELFQVAQAFTELGVKKIRLTGGEPMVRTDVMSLIEQMGTLPGLEELLLTTNGAQLEKYATRLKAAGVNRINVSVDSLDAERFKRISRVGKLESVLEGIEAAREAGFDRIRLNAVIMRGYNDDEVLNLTNYAVEREIDIAFIEEMPLGITSHHDREETTCSNDWVRDVIEQKYELDSTISRTAGPSKYFQIAGKASRIGFISPVSHNFCEDCNRVRVTVEGRLLLCLGNEHSIDLRAILRDSFAGQTELKQAIIDSMELKPERHYFYDKEHPQPVRMMNMTGG
ncbi:MAG: GTP 3',8-cyclase MoaA [Gammaproteobacteria bacterium]|jgi:cyclic pyranopterin phosphate synthase|nr:GTP 3',8-cyclase MoaA [Gammaproteobacteria bacterium]MDP6096649.1 GTP 3',8-cyclase MoaA [Gammaproteobacteria bacterium]MDP7455327.1 GTP 3',8-cyclase MoaA [Gammaproteobacteria bacterium]|tara:strand:- start:7717 stop:8724 length:1008 start_codon:yes stop_codon:yes gene_type:complete